MQSVLVNENSWLYVIVSKPLSETTVCIKQLFAYNDNLKRFAKGFYIKRKEGEREQDSGETKRERERESERQSIAGRGR